MAKQSKKPKPKAAPSVPAAPKPRPVVEPPAPAPVPPTAAAPRPPVEPVKPAVVPPKPVAEPVEPAAEKVEPVADPVAPAAEPVAERPAERVSMITINEYNDLTRTSLIEVIQPDGTARTVIAPVSAVPAAGRTRHSATTTTIEGSLSDLEAATAEAAVAAAALPEGEGLVRQQVSEALREMAQALSKLAESLDPR